MSLFILEVRLWLPCRFPVPSVLETDRGGHQAYRRKTSPDRNWQNLRRTKNNSGKEQPDTYVGMPVALLSMLRMCGKGSIKRALVSGDACPETVMNAIEKILETQLWPHYGSREMGLGGAICCAAHDGMHMREIIVLWKS